MAKTQNQKLAVTIIITVLNEEKSINDLIRSLLNQSRKPKEIIVVDGGSTDSTYAQLKTLAEQFKKVSVFQKKGNRSVGRNHAITKATTKLIAITDAGCIPDDEWLEQLLTAYGNTKKDVVVAGYYYADPQTDFEQAVVPYALVMPDRVDPKMFLPATRSMLLSKNTWHQLEGFDEKLFDNEDYDFARRLALTQTPIVFAQDALVKWQPRSTLRSFWIMIFRFARGDAFAQLFRLKVVFIFVRYSFGLGVLFLWWPLAAVGLAFYLIWSILKNYRYVKNGWYWLPILQVVSDLAVMAGTIAGLIQQLQKNVTST